MLKWLKVFAEVKPTLVYHCAAYTAVDAAEDEGKNWIFAINVTGTENVAKASEKYGATLVYISTDYVFDGKKPSDKNGKSMTYLIRRQSTGVPSEWGKNLLKPLRHSITSSALLGSLEIMVKTLSLPCKI